MTFDPVAGAYRYLEYCAFGRSLERCRFTDLDLAAGARQVLILGEGDGRFLARFLDANPTARVDAVDASPRMLDLAMRRVAKAHRGRVRFHNLDALADSPPGGPYDLIVTHFFLDCFPDHQVRALVAKYAALLSPGGAWLISEFDLPVSRLARLHAQAWLKAMYLFFQRSTHLQASQLPDWRTPLRNQHLHLEREGHTRFGLMVAQVWRSSA